MKSEIPVIGVFGHYGNRNLGDEAIIEATIDQIRGRLPKSEIICFSLRPDDTARRYGVPAYRIRCLAGESNLVLPGEEADIASLPWNLYARQQRAAEENSQTPTVSPGDESVKGLKERLKSMPLLGRGLKFAIRIYHLCEDLVNEAGYLVRSYNYLKKFDLLIITGSNQFLDNFGGPWQFPYTLMKWSLIARMTGTKLAYVSVGANPLASSLSKRMIHMALRRADYISYRDAASKVLIEGEKPIFNGAIYPDLAFGLNYQTLKSRGVAQKPTVGINPMPVYDHRYWCERDDGRYHDYVVKLARFSERLIEAGYPLFFFGTMWRDDDVIIDVLNEIKPEIRAKTDNSGIVRHSEQVDQLIDVLQQADIVVATRFHGTLLPLLVQIPVLGISYYRKNIDLMNEMGQGDYHEELDNLDLNELWKKFELLSKNLPAEKVKIARKSKEYSGVIGQQWDQVVSLIR